MRINKFFLNKKSQIAGRKMLYYAIFAFIASIAAIFIIYFTNSGKQGIAEIPSGLEDFLITQRFLNSPWCFALQDKDTLRTAVWTIDIEKFTAENMNKCYAAADTKVKAYRLTLSFGNDNKTVATKNWQGFIKKAETKQIFIYNNGNTQTGELFIEMQDVK